MATTFLDEASLRFRFEFIDLNYDYLAVFGLVGLLGTFIGSIGWAKHLDRSGRVSMGWWFFAVPWISLLCSYLIDGLNVHGSAGLVLLLGVPATILAIVLWIMAAMKPKQYSDGH